MRGRMCWGVALVVALLGCVLAVPAVAGEAVDWGPVFERARKRQNDFDWSQFDGHRGRAATDQDATVQSTEAPADAPSEVSAEDVAPKAVSEPVRSAVPSHTPASEPAPPVMPIVPPSMAPLPVIPVPDPPRVLEPAPVREPTPEKRYRIDFPGIDAHEPAFEPVSEPVVQQAPPAPLLTPEEEARARAEALAQPAPTVDVRSFDPAAWRESVADPAPLLTPEEEARARAEALAQPAPSIDVAGFDPAAWRKAMADKPSPSSASAPEPEASPEKRYRIDFPAPEPVSEPMVQQEASVPEAASAAAVELSEPVAGPVPASAPLLTPEEEARAQAEALAQPAPSIDVASLDPAAWREAVAPKPAYRPVEVEHFLDLALYDATAQTAHLDGGSAPRSLVVSRRADEVRLRVMGAAPAQEVARVEAVLRSLVPALSDLSGLPVRLVPATDRSANANVFVMAASPGDALEGYTKLTLDDGQAIRRSDTVLYQGASDAAVRREALRAMGLTGRSMVGRDTVKGESIMRPMPRGHGLPDLDATALAMLYRPELRAGMDYDEARQALEALRK